MPLSTRFSRLLTKTPLHSNKAVLSPQRDNVIYPPVDEAKCEIRYLILLPGKHNDPVRGLLAIAPLTEDDCPDFEALSYAWGSTNNLTEIAIKTVNDVEAVAVMENPKMGAYHRVRKSSKIDPSFSALRVTQNLVRALPYLRYVDKPRRLWIDAICINQGDEDERSSQVRRMRDIYSLATRVVVWLGPETTDTQLAFATLEMINSKLYFDKQTLEVKPSSNNPSDAYLINGVIPLTRVQTESITTVFKSAWFYRLWIWQEIHLAKIPRLQCGEWGIMWQEFCDALTVLTWKPVSIGEKGHGVVDDALWREWTTARSHVDGVCRFSANEGFLDLVEKTRNAECSDDRDRIYGMLALFRKDEITLEADYTKSVQEVYQAVVENYFDNTHSLDIVRLNELLEGGGRTSNLPSSVPDFAALRYRSKVLTTVTDACLATYGRRRVLVETDILKAPGARIAAVTGVFQCQIPHTHSPQEVIENLLAAVRALKLNLVGEYLSTGEPTGEAVGRMLCLGWFSERFHPPPPDLWSKSTISDLASALNKLHKGVHDLKFHSELEKFLRAGSKWMVGRSVFITDRGHIGLGPASIKPNDLVVNLVDCQMPLALRSESCEKFQLVGEVYCQGAMLGESIIGVVSPHMECVGRNLGTYTGYINRKTGILQVEDPRLDGVGVPDGWSRVGHEQEDLYTIWREETTGKKFDGHEFDPRLTMNELEKRGVVFEIFKIV